MSENWKLTQEALDKFLHWLDPDRAEAGKKYELIRRHLIFILTRRGCLESEDLADETVNRVARRVMEGLAETYRADPTPYLITVARNLYLENLEVRKITRDQIPMGTTKEKADDPFIRDQDRVRGEPYRGAKEVHKSQLKADEPRFAARSTMKQAPGVGMLEIADFLFSPKRVTLTFQPLIADWHHEYFEALAGDRSWKARWICVRYYWAFAKACGISKLFALVKTLLKVSSG
jgi:DNA-directed RNA polymerase specialized sigma24 family protein